MYELSRRFRRFLRLLRLLRPYAEANSDDQKRVVFPHHIPAPRVGHTNAARHHARMCVEPAGHGGGIAACKVRPLLHGLVKCRPRRRRLKRPWPMGVGLQKRGHCAQRCCASSYSVCVSTKGSRICICGYSHTVHFTLCTHTTLHYTHCSMQSHAVRRCTQCSVQSCYTHLYLGPRPQLPRLPSPMSLRPPRRYAR